MDKEDFYCKHRKGKVPGKSCFECYNVQKKGDERTDGFPTCKKINKVDHEKLIKLHKKYQDDERFSITVNHLNAFLIENSMPIEEMEDALLLIRLDYLK